MHMDPSPVIVWFRRDLRLADNPAYSAAVRSGRAVIPVYLHAPDEEAPRAPGSASRWWLHHALQALTTSLEQSGSRLVLRAGGTKETLRAVLRESGASTVYWNRIHDPVLMARDADLEASLAREGCGVEPFNGALLFEPWSIRNKAGNPFQVFTPFWRTCLNRGEPDDPIPCPAPPQPPRSWPTSLPLPALELRPSIPWDAGFHPVWTPGEQGAMDRLEAFCEDELAAYSEARDLPAEAGTSRLSPHLHFGEISPRQVWHAVQQATMENDAPGLVQGAETFLRELGWREFAYHLLHHFPHTPDKPLREAFNDFPWRRDPEELAAWQKGMTGYPVVDAAMRELWHTGWMHNRARMIVASFLVKDLLIPWQEGARWFHDTLVDADVASNTLGWQWAGGCGADAAPYFRIFNPTLQGRKFDAGGRYVRRWIPELAQLPDAQIHAPWEASPRILAAANVTLGATYPRPIVDHKAARDRALSALSEIKGDG